MGTRLHISDSDPNSLGVDVEIQECIRKISACPGLSQTFNTPWIFIDI